MNLKAKLTQKDMQKFVLPAILVSGLIAMGFDSVFKLLGIVAVAALSYTYGKKGG